MNEYPHKTYYIKYLEDIAKVSDSSVKHYLEGLRYISKLLFQKGKVNESIYEIQSMDELIQIREYLQTDPEFVSVNTRGNRMYSVALNHYCRFASGTEFAKEPEMIEILDTAVPKGEKTEKKGEGWSRSGIIKDQALESAGFLCEINPEHKTFTSQKTQKPYMEGHHALPMKFQDKFPYSLDVYANIICLCPVCHRLLHYAVKNEKKNAIDKIYYDRSERLAASGIEISRSDFEKYAM